MLKDRIYIDAEVYKDYFLLSAMQHNTGKIVNFEMYDGKPLETRKLLSLMANRQTVSFNGLNYDLLIIVAACSGYDNQALKNLSDRIIKSNKPSWLISREQNLNVPTQWDHVDLIEVAPGRSSLKIYGGRLNAKKLQDLPIEPDASITPDLRELMRKYCVNDLETTKLLCDELEGAIVLREQMGEQYGMDLRSKSDAQIAETIIKSELKTITGRDYRKPNIPDDFGFYYRDPKVVEFQSEQLKEVYSRILETRFGVGGNGSVVMPAWLRENRIVIDDAEYQMGIGGLHSCEKSQYIAANDDELLFELDVASYYPNIIMQQQLAPDTLGRPFLDLYQSLIDRRIKAKREKDKVTDATLKISINGSFGKLGSKYSFLYAPELLIQTTITGQLCLLMIIERMTAAGIKVVSANTDGVVLLCPKHLEKTMQETAFDWMLDTSYTLERTDYKALASRDVNNYVAVKLDGSTKGKGVFASTGLSKNPDCPIVFKAVSEFIANGVCIEQTIKGCDDITQFLSVRRVNGGAVWRDEPLGRAVRFYYSTDVASDECIHYATNSNRVPKSAGAKPLMNLPDTLPSDIDYHVYIVDAEKLLCEVGYVGA